MPSDCSGACACDCACRSSIKAVRDVEDVVEKLEEENKKLKAENQRLKVKVAKLSEDRDAIINKLAKQLKELG